MNVTLFMPQVAEHDVFDSRGAQIDDINSVFEWVDEIVLGHIDNTPEDEDDDMGLSFVVVKTTDLFCECSPSGILPPCEYRHPERVCPPQMQDVPPLSSDVLSPPPEA